MTSWHGSKVMLTLSGVLNKIGYSVIVLGLPATWIKSHRIFPNSLLGHQLGSLRRRTPSQAVTPSRPFSMGLGSTNPMVPDIIT